MRTQARTHRLRVCAAVRAPGDMILVMRDDPRVEQGWHLPGGHPKAGESLKTALVREVNTETGYAIVATDIAYVAEHGGDRGNDGCLEICFYAEIVGATNELVWSAGASVVGGMWLATSDPRLRTAATGAHVFLGNRTGQYLQPTENGSLRWNS